MQVSPPQATCSRVSLQSTLGVSEYARRQLKARAFGSSIPSLDESAVAGVVLPKLDDPGMEELGHRAFAVRTKRHHAIEREREARALVESWIEVRAGA